MVDKVTEELFSASEWKSLEKLAERRGFTSVRSYVRTLIDNDAAQHIESLTEEDALEDQVASFRNAWDQAMRGE